MKPSLLPVTPPDAAIPSRIIPVILAGGEGRRLRSHAASAEPKQFLSLDGTYSLLQQTLRQVADSQCFTPPVIVSHAEYRPLLARHCAARGIPAPQMMILEPVRRNTAAAIALAAAWCARHDSPEHMMLILPADHDMTLDAKAWYDALLRARQAARDGWIVAFGVPPCKPETRFGYIRRGGDLPYVDGAYIARSFKEKPDDAMARAYVEQGGYYWNSGMFLLSLSGAGAAFRRYAGDIWRAATQAWDDGAISPPYAIPDRASLEALPAVAFDRAIMEKARKIAVIPLPGAWEDVGTPEAFERCRERRLAARVA